MKLIKFSDYSLNLLSDCILSKMEELSTIHNVSKELKQAIDDELDNLKAIHSKVCEGMKDSEKTN